MNRNDSETAHVEDLGGGAFAIRGNLTFGTIATLLAESKTLFAAYQRIEISMSNVQQADSAGLALLLEWLSWARGYNRNIVYQNIPDQILAIAQISDVTELLTGEAPSGDA